MEPTDRVIAHTEARLPQDPHRRTGRRRSPFRTLISGTLSQRRQTQVSKVITRGERRAAAGLARLMSRLPPRLIGMFKERFETTVLMDYSKGDIWLAIDSEVEATRRANSCRKEPETVQWIEDYIQSGDVVYDIGANIGAYSFVIDQWTHGGAIVYAFEPSFANFSQLNRNIQLNQCEGRVVPLNVALADRTEIGEFSYASLSTGSSRHSIEIDLRRSTMYRQCVLLHRLDDLVEQFAIPSPNHIKLDVDGVEFAILRGAERLLSGGTIRSILVEVELGRVVTNELELWLCERKYVLVSRHQHGASSTANCIFLRLD